ncbi:MAG: glutamate-1-semialdehyde 2,1-aminomutase [Lachnospirales bacterium]
MNTKTSLELFQKAKKIIPGGVNSPVRAFNSVGGNPLFITKAKGSKIYDADGNQYIDYVSSWGPNILGNGNDEVLEAVKAACNDGLTYGAPTEKEIILAQLITELIPSMDMVRLVSSGTEAVMSAIRVARAYSKKSLVIKFNGCYHGHSDGLLAKAGSGLLTNSLPDSAGVPTDYTKLTLLADFNDQNSVEKLFKNHGQDIACLIVEPVPANMGIVLPNNNFLKFLREITKKYNSLLIFDEVITGFRLGTGGASKYFDIDTDLITLGKIVGGGMPIGAFGGKKEIMEYIAPLGNVYQAGTLSGNPISTAAGIATLNILKNNEDIYKDLDIKGERLKEAFELYSKGEVIVNQIGSLLTPFFARHKVNSYNDALCANTKKYKDYFWFMLENGIYTSPSQYEAMFISHALNEEDINYTIKVIKKFFDKF